MNNLPTHEFINCICKKDWPTLRPFNALINVRSNSNRRPTILAIRGTFISCRFINKNQLFGREFKKLFYPYVPKFLISFSSMLLCLLIRPACKNKIVCDETTFHYSYDKYLLFIPLFSLKKALNRGYRSHHTIFISNEIDHFVKISSTSMFEEIHEALQLVNSGYQM